MNTMSRAFSVMNSVDAKQQVQINVAIVVLTALTTFVAVHSYLQAREGKAIDDRMQALDLEIKTLTLQKLKQENGNSSVK